MKEGIAIEVQLDKPFDEAVNLVEEMLKTQGFGVLTRIDVQATIKEKLNKDFRSFVILGACNPALAHRALSEDAVVGLMLPCNVTIESVTGNKSVIRLANPETMMTVGNLKDNDSLASVAAESRQKIEKVAASLLDT